MLNPRLLKPRFSSEAAHEPSHALNAKSQKKIFWNKATKTKLYCQYVAVLSGARTLLRMGTTDKKLLISKEEQEHNKPLISAYHSTVNIRTIIPLAKFHENPKEHSGYAKLKSYLMQLSPRPSDSVRFWSGRFIQNRPARGCSDVSGLDWFVGTVTITVIVPMFSFRMGKGAVPWLGHGTLRLPADLPLGYSDERGAGRGQPHGFAFWGGDHFAVHGVRVVLEDIGYRETVVEGQANASLRPEYCFITANFIHSYSTDVGLFALSGLKRTALFHQNVLKKTKNKTKRPWLWIKD